ncbi:acyl-CoA synthetase [Virgibacillus phasianinus]|uniref:Acyl-CoA synthetase n=1 Tax=Virgibacillus phasianinus TaxID=2017483 RepID=A0A220U3L4_9BACI|nr:AMP-binding protein [Virgibacillus phasianinus]ASK62687.1 acyl-CoA synthetase [Virgibacillus phasianinus]
MNITSTYTEHAAEFPNKTAVQLGDTEISYGKWSKLINQTANWFYSQGTEKKVGIFFPNCIEFLQVYTGAAAAGWIAMPLDTKWKPAEIEKRLQHTSPALIITTKKLASKIKIEDVPIVCWEQAQEEITIASFTNVPVNTINDKDFHIGFTSGSTGEPKAFTRSHASWIASFACNKNDFHMDADDRVLIPGSLVHSHFLYGAISTLYLGGTVHLQRKFSPATILRAIFSDSVSVVYTVPTMIEAMLRENVPVTNSFKIISSGAKWEKNSKQRMRKLFSGMIMYEFYGASELSFVTSLSDQENINKPASVGKACHNVEIQIRQANQELAYNQETGKIFVKSPMLFSGYTTHPNKFHKDDWFTVDDMGYLDEEGYLYIIGREKNIINYGGINIFPEEIENVLMMHTDVYEAAVTSISSDYWGEVAVAIIDGSTSILSLKRWCKDYLASYKVPRKWIMKESIPHTISGKIARKELHLIAERRLLSKCIEQ